MFLKNVSTSFSSSGEIFKSFRIEAISDFLFMTSTILFIGVGLVIFKMTMPAVAVGATVATQGSFMESVMGFFMDKRILISLLIAALIVIIFLALKIAGVFGKSN